MADAQIKVYGEAGNLLLSNSTSNRNIWWLGTVVASVTNDNYGGSINDSRIGTSQVFAVCISKKTNTFENDMVQPLFWRSATNTLSWKYYSPFATHVKSGKIPPGTYLYGVIK